MAIIENLSMKKPPQLIVTALNQEMIQNYLPIPLTAFSTTALITLLSALERFGLTTPFSEEMLSFASSRNTCVLACGISSNLIK